MYGKKRERARRRLVESVDFELSGRTGEKSRAGDGAVKASSDATLGPLARREDAVDVMGRSSMSSVVRSV